MNGTPRFQFVPGWQEIIGPVIAGEMTADDAIRILEHRDEQIESYLSNFSVSGNGAVIVSNAVHNPPLDTVITVPPAGFITVEQYTVGVIGAPDPGDTGGEVIQGFEPGVNYVGLHNLSLSVDPNSVDTVFPCLIRGQIVMYDNNGFTNQRFSFPNAFIRSDTVDTLTAAHTHLDTDEEFFAEAMSTGGGEVKALVRFDNYHPTNSVNVVWRLSSTFIPGYRNLYTFGV